MVGEQGGIIAVTETASQVWRMQRTVERALVDRVEAAKIALQERISERMYERSEVIDAPKISRCQAVENIPQERISERRCEKRGHRCHQGLKPRPKFAAHSGADDRCDQNLRRRPGLAVKQLLDDIRHEPISRISASTRELRRILSLFERVREKMEPEGQGGEA